MTKHCSSGRRPPHSVSAGHQRPATAGGHATGINGRVITGRTGLGPQPGSKPGQPRRPGETSRAAVIQLPGAPAVPDGKAEQDRGRGWLRGAMLALGVLAVAAAVVSWDAQYVLVRSVKHDPAVAALEAGIPDVGALIFATLGIALALHARRAVRARVLNVACVGISLAMNALASAPGWRDLAIWVMPSAIYALASDTLIGVVRAWVIARATRTGQALADDEPTPIALVGAVLLWALRLGLAPVSTLTGFRRWVIEECPVAPGRKLEPGRAASRRRPGVTAAPPAKPLVRAARGKAAAGKQARLIALASQRHDLTVIPLSSVSRIATAIAAELDLAPGTARRVLLAHVRDLQSTNHDARGTS